MFHAEHGVSMRAKRIDNNQTDIVKAFRDVGFSVAVTSALGNGFPDIVVGAYGKNYLIEIKDGEKKLTDKEASFFIGWAGQYHIIRNSKQANDFILRILNFENPPC